MDNRYSEIEIYEVLKDKYKGYFKEALESVSIVQGDDYILLRSIETYKTENGLVKKVTVDNDLTRIGSDEDTRHFDLKDDIEINVNKFIEEFTKIGFAYLVDLFTKEKIESICEEIEARNLE